MSSQLSPRNLLTIGVGSVSYVTLDAFSAIIPNRFGFGFLNKRCLTYYYSVEFHVLVHTYVLIYRDYGIQHLMITGC